MKEQIELLRELQEAELKIRVLRGDQERYPHRIRELDERLASEKEAAVLERERLQALEKERRKKEGELTQDGERIKKTKGRLFEVKTNKEYQALLHEIELMEKSIGQKEDEILVILEEIDQLRGSVSEREGALDSVEKETLAEKSQVEEKLAHLVKEIAAVTRRREGIIKTLDPALMRAYETLKEKRGMALAAVQRGVCQGCAMLISLPSCSMRSGETKC